MRQVPLSPTMTLDAALTVAVEAAGDATLVADGQRATLRELFAVVRLGAVVVPLDPELPPEELARVAAVVPLRATLSDRPRPGPGRLDVVTDGLEWRVPGPQGDVGARLHGARLHGAHRARSDVAAVFLTSGTTGNPKPVPLTHHQLLRPLLALQRLHAAFFSGSPLQQVKRVATVAARHGTKLLRASGKQTWFTASPFRSMAGHQVLLGCLLLGHDLVTCRTFSPRRVLELLDTHRVHVLAGTPAVLELLLRVEDLSPYDLSSLLVIGIGGGPAPPELVERGRARFSCAVTIGYGSTELGGGVLATRLEDSLDSQARSVGRPFPGAAVRVVGDDGAELPAGETGELLCRTSEDEPWLRTGDLAVLHPDGSIGVVGRSDDLVIRGGSNVHPAEVERVAAQLPGVRRCAAVGVPVRGDQQLWLFVVGAPDRGLDELRQHCRASLPPGKQPDRVRRVDELPTNEYGEVLRRRLREQALAELAGAGRHEETG
jgi:long-chain acyl-CoA synthetase